MKRMFEKNCTCLHFSREGLALLWGLVVVVIVGCGAVGPDYIKPAIHVPNHWHSTAGDIQKGVSKQLSQWWQHLEDPMLMRLIYDAAGNNLDIRKAISRVREARYLRSKSLASLWPSLNTASSLQKSRTSSPQSPDIEEDLYAVNLDASWELDFFGSKRREVEASQADVESEIEEMHDVMVTLLAEMAVNYADLRTAQARLQVALKNVAAQTNTWELTDAMFRAGRENELSLDQARYNLESSRSIIPELEEQKEKAMNRIAVLTGHPPGTLHKELADVRSIPSVSVELAVGVPADVIRHRADIRKAERELAAQTARIGVAKADLYPKLSLIGSIGLEAISARKLFSGDERKWSFGPSITFPLFDGGTIRSNIKANMEMQQQALSQYENAVLSALEEVENALVTYAKDVKNNKTLKAAVKAARSAAQLAEIQFSSGVSGFTDVLDAQRSLFSFEDQLIQNQGDAFSDLIRLYKALGGGWKSFEHVAVPELFPDNNE